MNNRQKLQELKTRNLRQVTHISDPNLVAKGFVLQALLGTILISQINNEKGRYTISFQKEGKIYPAFTPQKEFKLGKITSTIKQFYLKQTCLKF